MIPSFNNSGNLPPGIHDADWNELKARFGQSPHRAELLEGLHEALVSLRSAGCRNAYLDGSFVTAKEKPGDFDACWDPKGVVLDELDPVLLDFSDGRRAQKERFRGELFPADVAAEPGGTSFLEFFQRQRNTEERKGIVKIDLEDLA
ncbi:MAG TPA: hypothetical protein VF081_07315 [Solirubrobacterales bacterium]